MTISDLVPRYFPTPAAVARALGISKQAVYKWGDGEIPEGSALKLKYEVIPSIEISPSVETSAA